MRGPLMDIKCPKCAGEYTVKVRRVVELEAEVKRLAAEVARLRQANPFDSIFGRSK